MSHHVLIAEFDRQRATLYQDTVEECGFEAVVVRDGNVARASLQTRGAPAILVTDLSLPGSDGFSLITDLRRRFPLKKIPVIVFSAFPELRATAADLLASLDITELRDKNSPATVVRDVIEKALADLSKPEAPPPIDVKTPEQLSHKFLQGVARTFQVPVTMLAVDLRQHYWFTAYVGLAEPVMAFSDKEQWWGVMQQVVNSRQPLVVPDLSRLFGTPSIVPPLRVRGVAAVPFTTSRDRVIGVLTLIDFKPLLLGPEQIDAVMEAGRAMADEFSRRYASDMAAESATPPPRTEEHWQALERLALTDSLTELYNRHAGEEAIAREAARSRRAGSGLSLALLDLDNLKQINDLHGHDAGDLVLAGVGRILKTSFRASDLAIRWGGDEFLIVLPDVALAGAVAVAERIRMQVETLSFTGVGRVTLSGGVVEVGHTEDPFVALRRADVSLYEAKAAGRNRVTSAPGASDHQVKTG